MSGTPPVVWRRLRIWLVVGTSLGGAMAFFALWLGSRHEAGLSLERREAVWRVTTDYLGRLMELAWMELQEGSLGRLSQLLPVEDVPFWAAMRWQVGSGDLQIAPERAGSLASHVPSNAGSSGESLFVENPAASQELVAVFHERGTTRSALLVDLPRLLLWAGLARQGTQSLLLVVKLPARTPRYYACGIGAEGAWVCARTEPVLLGDGEGALWDAPRVADASGTLLTQWLQIGPQRVGVGVLVPAGEAPGSFSPAWLALLFLALLVVGGGVALGRALAVAQQRHEARELELAHREAELAAKLAEKQWQLVLDGVRQPMLFLREELVVRANQEAAKLLRFEHAGDVIGRKLASLLPVEERDRVLKLLPVALAERGSFTTRLLCGRGGERVVEVKPWLLEVGGEAFICLSLADFTGRQRAEAVLRAVSSRVGAGLALLDLAGQVMWVNPALADALGLRPEDLVGRTLLPFVTPPAWRAVTRAFARARRGQEQTLEVRCRVARGVVAPFELIFSRVAGEPCVLLVANQLTSSQEVEDALSLVAAVVGWEVHRAANLLQGALGEPVKGRGTAAHWREVASQLATQLHDLQRLVRQDHNHMARVELNSLVQEATAALPDALPHGVRLLLRPWPEGLWAAASPHLLRHFLRETLAAFLACFEGGSGTLEVAVERLPVGMARVAVAAAGEAWADSGHDHHTFDARLYSRALSWLTARALKGHAGYREREGFGSRVWLDLPLAFPVAQPEAVPVPRRGKILIAEDERHIRETLAEVLRQQGYQVVEAANGREALSLYASEAANIALVVLDLVMPELDGRQVYEELSKKPNPPAVLLCTGYRPASDPLLGNLPTLVKPFTLEVFLREVAKWVELEPSS